jgi:actin-like ATPase involved in cell morphogenesis
MNRTTIDFGIDLGTTNSAIAVLKGVSSEIIKNNFEADITPSAVCIDKKGTVFVGQRAKNSIFDRLDDTCIEFKLHMGTDRAYQFKSSGQSRRPEELSAEILKSLRADVQQRTGETVEACVVTVPAAFELNQCDATRKAAKLAGFKESPLLQEPVAAALAHGFQADREKAYWFVYDFGGGTFDAAVIKAEEGTVHVVNHGGDNFLGGSDIDWALVEHVLVPRILAEFNLKDFTRSNKAWRSALTKLKHFAEKAKIELSRSERTTLELCKFQDGEGEEIEFECELSRGDIIRVAEPVILRSVEICNRVLKEKNLSRDAVEKVILVGGPTLAPYFRELLESNLGIPLDHRVDPLTVVARGAAIFAGTQRFERRAASPVAGGEYSVDLKYKPVGMDSLVRRLIEKGLIELVSQGGCIEGCNTPNRYRVVLGEPLQTHGVTDGRPGVTVSRGVRGDLASPRGDPEDSNGVTHGHPNHQIEPLTERITTTYRQAAKKPNQENEPRGASSSRRDARAIREVQGSGLLEARVSGLVNRLTAEFALSNKQREAVREYCNSLGIEYVDAKADIVRMQPRKNAAGALLAALRDDWQAPVSVGGAVETEVDHLATSDELARRMGWQW